MIIYQGEKSSFLNSVEMDTIAPQIDARVFAKTKRHVSPNEYRSWENSMQYMYKVLSDSQIPNDAGIAIEYNIPQTSKRVDFMISGYDASARGNVVIVELKQWDKLKSVEGKDGLVETFTGGGIRQVVHPSYQAWSYATLIRDYNETVWKNDVILWPCAYLHNYLRVKNDPLDAAQYGEYLKDAPAFSRGEVYKLREFIRKSIVTGDRMELIYSIDQGRIRPSKSLQDAIVGMVKRNAEFTMIDDQKVVFEHILAESRASFNDGKRRVVIIEGGPGTGKTVVAVNLHGVWACASLLHASRVQLPTILQKINCALKSNGVAYLSFKYGTNSKVRNGRFFTDMREEDISFLCNSETGFAVEEFFITEDVRPDRPGERWLNIYARKI